MCDDLAGAPAGRLELLCALPCSLDAGALESRSAARLRRQRPYAAVRLRVFFGGAPVESITLTDLSP